MSSLLTMLGSSSSILLRSDGAALVLIDLRLRWGALIFMFPSSSRACRWDVGSGGASVASGPIRGQSGSLYAHRTLPVEMVPGAPRECVLQHKGNAAMYLCHRLIFCRGSCPSSGHITLEVNASDQHGFGEGFDI